MNKIYSLLLLITFVIFTGCVNDEDDIFNESAINRIETVLKEHKAVLTAHTNGWVMEYFAGGTNFGGYTLLLSFDDKETVTIASELADASETMSSLYTLKADNGPVLSFNSYNDLMHYFSEPRNPDGIGSLGIGVGGDFEFIILESSPELIKLKGKKTGTYIVMTPMKDETPWSDYLAEIKTASTKMFYTVFEATLDSEEIGVVGSYRSLTFSYEEDGEEVSKNYPYIITLTGYKFYEPFTINDVEISELVFVDDETPYFKNPTGELILIPRSTPLNLQLVNGDWYFAYSGLSPSFKLTWNYTLNNGFIPNGQEMYYAYLGTYNGMYGFCLAGVDDSYYYPGAIKYNYQLVDEDKILFSWGGSTTGSGSTYYSGGFLCNFIVNELLVETGQEEFILTADNPSSAGWIKLQSSVDPNLYMTVYNRVIYFPYDN